MQMAARIVVFTMMVVMVCVGAVAQATDYDTVLEERPCYALQPIGEVEGETLLCGKMWTPLDWDNPGGATIEIAYNILKATGDNPQPDPILFLSGGPGSSAIVPQSFIELANRFAPFRRDRDLIFFDQRGVGASLPAFFCGFPDEAQTQVIRDDYEPNLGREMIDSEIYAAACGVLNAESDIDITQYSTSSNAKDTLDLMEALGYESYNLYGVSYGARLALMVQHRYANDPMIRSVTLDSVFPLPENLYHDVQADYYFDQHALFEQVFAACDADTACHDAYPYLRTSFDALVAQLNTNPIDLDGYVIDGDEIYRHVYPYNQAIQYIPYQPRMIAELLSGDTSTLEFLLSGAVRPTPSMGVMATGDGDLIWEFMQANEACAFGDETTDLGILYAGIFGQDGSALVDVLEANCPEGTLSPEAMTVAERFTADDVSGLILRSYFVPIDGNAGQLRDMLHCVEEDPYRQPPETMLAELETNNIPQVVLDDVNNLLDESSQCQFYDGYDSAQATEAVFDDTPTLILNGALDFVTPATWAVETHDRLSNSFLFIFPNTMHSIVGNYGDCPTQITYNFLADPTQEPDRTCLDTMGIEFVMPDVDLG